MPRLLAQRDKRTSRIKQDTRNSLKVVEVDLFHSRRAGIQVATVARFNRDDKRTARIEKHARNCLQIVEVDLAVCVQIARARTSLRFASAAAQAEIVDVDYSGRTARRTRSVADPDSEIV